MEAAATLRAARRRAGLTQAELARRAATSQATVSHYERGTKQPSVDTFARLLAAASARLTVAEGRVPVVARSEADLRRAGRILADVLALAEQLPARHEPELRYPRLAA